MRNKIFTTLIFAFFLLPALPFRQAGLPFALNAQSITWEKVMNYTSLSVFYKAQPTSDSGYIAAGINRIGNNYKMYIAKFNKFGDTLWTKYYDLNINSSFDAFWVEQTFDGDYIIGGSGPGGIAGLLKLNTLGIVQWYKTFSDGWQTLCVKQTSDKGYILAVRTSSYGPTDDFKILKTDSLGNIMWNKLFIDNSAEDYIYEITPLGNNGYIAAGTKWPLNDSSNAYLIRLNINGDTLWTKQIGGSRNDGAHSVDVTADTGFIIGGYSFSYNPNYYQSYIVKVDANGNIQWQRTYSVVYNEQCFSIRYLAGKGYVFCGQSDSVYQFGEKAFIRIIDFTGNIILEKFYRAGDDSNRFYSLESTFDGGFILAGYADYIVSSTKAYIVKTDSLGNVNPIGINIISNEIPIKSELFQNYPNPFNPVTHLEFRIADFGFVIIKVYNITGKEVTTLLKKDLRAGTYRVDWNASNYPSGVYFYNLEISGKNIEGKKMILIK